MKKQTKTDRKKESEGEEKAVKKHLKEDIKESKMSISKDKKLMKKVK